MLKIWREWIEVVACGIEDDEPVCCVSVVILGDLVPNKHPTTNYNTMDSD